MKFLVVYIFELFFFGVNITFFPMHFLGLAGMPRRIPDYPDPYYFWNSVASYGSLLSGFSFLIFLYVITRALSFKGSVSQFSDGWSYDMLSVPLFKNISKKSSKRIQFFFCGQNYWM